MAIDSLRVRVRSIAYQGAFINAYELVDLEGRELPPFSAGDHIDLYFRDGRTRQYSLSNNPSERHRYVFTVLRDPHGRGGSKAIFELVHVGRILTISKPRSNFPLAEEADRHLLLAGGIGVTPMMAMIYRLHDIGADFVMHYCTRSPDVTSFQDELAPFISQGKVVIHHDGGDPSKGLDIGSLLHENNPGTHLYYCGPTGFMRAVERAASHWPAGTIHFEYFTPPVSAEAVPASMMNGDSAGSISIGFKVQLSSNGATYNIPDDKSIIDVLKEQGIDIQTSCEAGICRTCKTRYLDGEPDHRDFILDDDEKEEYILICCSRSKSPLLVLDL